MNNIIFSKSIISSSSEWVKNTPDCTIKWIIIDFIPTQVNNSIFYDITFRDDNYTYYQIKFQKYPWDPFILKTWDIYYFTIKNYTNLNNRIIQLSKDKNKLPVCELHTFDSTVKNSENIINVKYNNYNYYQLIFFLIIFLIIIFSLIYKCIKIKKLKTSRE